ncbi:hypothetical protein D3C78_1260720 [compost metagenome]
MSVRGIDCNQVYTRVNKGFCPFKRILGDTYCRPYQQSPLSIFSCIRELDRFLNILNRNKSLQDVALVNQWKLLDFMLLKDNLRFRKRCSYRSRHEIVACHNLADFNFVIMNKTQITIRQNTDQFMFIINDRYTGNTEFPHNFFCIRYQMICRKRERICYNTALGTFYTIHFLCLLFNGHILMNNSNAAFTCNGNGKCCFRYRIHPCADQWNVKLNIVAELRGYVDLFWQYF